MIEDFPEWVKEFNREVREEAIIREKQKKRYQEMKA